MQQMNGGLFNNSVHLSSRLDALTDEELRRVKDYERRTKNRETLLHQIERRIQRAS